MREVRRFTKVAMQTVGAPVITSMLFMMVFAVAVGDRAKLAGDIDFLTFLVPGLVMMTVLQNAFANTSSSLVVSKVQGNIVDILMPPVAAGELLAGLAAGGMTRGIAVGIVAAIVLGAFGDIGLPAAPFAAICFLVLGSLALSFAGILAGVWANKFDEMAAITNFVIQPLAFLSGTFYSVDRLPPPFDLVATLNPVFYAIDGFRFGMIGVADRPVVTGLLVLVLVNLVLGALCYRVLASGFRLKAEPVRQKAEGKRDRMKDAEMNDGILPVQEIRDAIAAGHIAATIPPTEAQLQPASMDLRLGTRGWRVRSSFLPGSGIDVARKLDKFAMHEIDLSDGAVLERGCVYIVELQESLALPDTLSALANPKSSTGRLDVFTRLITDGATESRRLHMVIMAGSMPRFPRAPFRCWYARVRACRSCVCGAGQAACRMPPWRRCTARSD